MVTVGRKGVQAQAFAQGDVDGRNFSGVCTISCEDIHHRKQDRLWKFQLIGTRRGKCPRLHISIVAINNVAAKCDLIARIQHTCILPEMNLQGVAVISQGIVRILAVHEFLGIPSASGVWHVPQNGRSGNIEKI